MKKQREHVTREELVALADDELGERQSERVHEHLRVCAECDALFQEYRKARKLGRTAFPRTVEKN